MTPSIAHGISIKVKKECSQIKRELICPGGLLRQLNPSKKQQEDDKKAVERNRKELVRLDQQLKVSKIQFTKIRELNHELSRRLEEEKARTGDKEYTLKGTVETLQKEMRETNSVRTDLEVQVKECTTRHECLTKNVEAMKTKLKNATEQSAAEQQWLNKEVADLESKYKGQKMTAEELTEKLATIKENFDTMTSTLGYEVEELQRTVREQNVRKCT
jgi:chromosome segregation ATPase